MHFHSLAPLLLAAVASARFVMYADEWHPTRPTNPEDRAGIDHIVLAFAMANNTAAFQPKVPMSTIKSEFPTAKIMIAVGGWGDTIGFSEATKTDAGIEKFANDVKTMLTNTGADGVDIDWEYPGGNGADYKQIPNSAKTHEIAAFPKLLAAVRAAIGPEKLLSIAVPGKKGDMIAYTADTGPLIWPSVDYINIMSYDLMNRRDNTTTHHTSVTGALTTVQTYLSLGAPPSKINLGFAYYAKYFSTAGDCGPQPLGCPIVPAEDPVTGADTLTSGAWTFERSHMVPVDAGNLPVSQDGTCGPEKGTRCAGACCSQYGNCGVSREHCSGGCWHAFGTGCTDPDVAGSWQLAVKGGVSDQEAGGQYFWDGKNGLFWTWDTPEFMTRKFREVVGGFGLGGVMAWSLGEDSADWSHIRLMGKAVGGAGYGVGGPSGTLDAQVPATEATEAPVSDPTDIPTTPDDTEELDYDVVWVDGTGGPDAEDAEEPETDQSQYDDVDADVEISSKEGMGGGERGDEGEDDGAWYVDVDGEGGRGYWDGK